MRQQDAVTRYTCQKQYKAMREVYSHLDYWRCRACNDITTCQEYKPLGLVRSFLFTVRQFYHNNISVSSLPIEVDEEPEKKDLEQKTEKELINVLF